MLTTPVTLFRRISLFGNLLRNLDLAIFDEIDTYLTVDELRERADMGPALTACLQARLPVLGFTGTHLTKGQVTAWSARGFVEVQLDVPAHWMPRTPIRFVPVRDPMVIAADADIRERLKIAYHKLAEKLRWQVRWSDVKQLAKAGDRHAISILQLIIERLLLFESPGSTSAKYDGIATAVEGVGPSLVLTRYRRTAKTIAQIVSETGVPVAALDGSMSRVDIDRGADSFRATDTTERSCLVITRELGGRGLDFPNAARAIIVSPRSNYQAVAQELARIRSRQESPKEAYVFYYEKTEEAAKARRLGEHLRRDRYGSHHLFTVIDLPAKFELEPFESRNLRFEESVTDLIPVSP
jgi:superfamily II DNA or RNA helicase